VANLISGVDADPACAVTYFEGLPNIVQTQEFAVTDSPLLAALRLVPAGRGRFQASNVALPQRPVVFGGQLIGQLGIAAEITVGKPVRSVQAVFPRAAMVTTDLDISVDVVHQGRAMASAVVRVQQGGRDVCVGLVLLDSGDADVIRHARPMPPVPDPGAAAPVEAESVAELRLVGGPSIMDSEPSGPPEVNAWVRFPYAAPGDPGLHRALAAWYTDGLLISAAMRPHPIGLEMAHKTLSTGVLTHTITFHEPVDASDWLLVTQTSTQAGGGRCYGTGAVYTREGVLLASFAQEAMIRAFAPDRPRGVL
jgi:acyl-CoA thioesterase